MATQKFDLSLRLRHPDADLAPIVRGLGLRPSACWTKGDRRFAPDGGPLQGIRDSSYCSVPLHITSGADLELALDGSLQKIASLRAELESLVNSGGTASIAIGWFTDGDAGMRVAEKTVADMARLRLTLDLYLYVSPGSVVAR
jgi:hypothetical protein